MVRPTEFGDIPFCSVGSTNALVAGIIWMNSLNDPNMLLLGAHTIPDATPGPGPLIVTGVVFMRLCDGMHISRKRRQVGISVGRIPMLKRGIGIGPTGVGCR